MPDRHPMLRVDSLYASYDKIEAVKGVSLEVAEGRMVAVIGPNGAGKSTLLSAIAGLRPPRKRGAVWLEGQRVDQLSASEIVARRMALVPEGRQIFYPLTVHENLLLGGYADYLRRMRTETAERLEAVYRLFPVLRQRTTQLAGTLSGGEQQMVAIGRALMASPKVLLLDEPSLGLAPLLVEEIFRVILELRQKGVTIVLVEQNAQLALEIADYAYVMETGKMALDGSAKSLVQDERVRRVYLGM